MQGLKTTATEGAHMRGAHDRPRRVLYAEDQSTARTVTTALLTRMGYDVQAVEDGELALECARKEAFDIILLDIEMPVMDGVTAARSIRAEQGPSQKAPILALSAFLADSTEHSVWRDAFDSTLPKPANSNELQQALQSALSTREKQVADRPKLSTWAMMANTLPRGTRTMLVQAAAREMSHVTLAYFACQQAKDCDGARRCRHALDSMAASFEAEELRQALAGLDSPHGPDGSWIFHAIDVWLKRELAA